MTSERLFLASLLTLAASARADREVQVPPSNSTAAPPAAPGPAAPQLLRTELHLASQPDVELHRLADDSTICRGACDATVWFLPGERFVFAGPGIVPSEPFVPREGQDRLTVQPGHLLAKGLGTGLAAVGLAGMTLGLVTIADPLANHSLSTPLLILGGSAGAAFAGVILYLASTTTWSRP